MAPNEVPNKPPGLKPTRNGVLVTEYVNVLKEVYVKVFVTGVFNLDGRDGSYVISRIM